MIAQSYSHPFNGAYNETVATLADGRKVVINTQYGDVIACGVGSNISLADLDKAALIAEAREHGKFGDAPVTPVQAAQPVAESARSAHFERWMASGEGEL